MSERFQIIHRRSFDGAGGIGGLLARTSGSGGGGGGEAEVSKSLMTLNGSEQCAGWNFALAANGLTTDPGWANCTYTRPVEFLRVDLGGEHNVSHVAYEPRVMSASPSDGTWNGVYKDYAIYVTDSPSDHQVDWGAAVATGTWTWPNLQERKDVTFTPKTGRTRRPPSPQRKRSLSIEHFSFANGSNEQWQMQTEFGRLVPLLCVFASLRENSRGKAAAKRGGCARRGSQQECLKLEWGNPGYAGANEIWVYEQTGGGGSGSWSLASETRYLYDGKLVVQERDSSNTPLVTYNLTHLNPVRAGLLRAGEPLETLNVLAPRQLPRGSDPL